MQSSMGLPTVLVAAAYRVACTMPLFAIVAIIIYAVYNIYFHPLARFPGPFFWRLTRLAYLRSMFSGRLHNDILDWHKLYGPVVRIAPNELSYTDPRIWQDIFTRRNGTPPFTKYDVWFKPRKAEGHATSLLTARDAKEHARIRRALNPGFTKYATLRHEPVITSYVDTLISKLEDLCDQQSEAIDIVRWYNFAIFDIIGDLGFGESFQCLEKEQQHPWMSIIITSFKSVTLTASLEFYSDKNPLKWLLSLFIPAPVTKDFGTHFRNIQAKVERRLNLEQERPDFLSLIVQQDRNGKATEGLTRKEVESNAHILVTAGSETIAIMCSGITNYLVQTPRALKALENEVRASFDRLEDITLAKLTTLSYLQAVLMEGYRLCPPTPIGVPHVVPSGGALVCGEFLPAGSVVNAYPIGLGMRPENFFAPKSFWPERWLPKNDSSSPFNGDNLESIRPWGAGPRQCIGKNLAAAEIQLIIAKMLWKFDISAVDSLDWLDQQSFFVTEKKPFKVCLRVHH